MRPRLRSTGKAVQREVWTTLGDTNPDWAVLTVRSRRAGGWDDELEQFYDTGRDAVAECLSLAGVERFGRALDYGCGTGRLSLALAERFEHVTAVDISEPMRSRLSARAAERSIANITPVAPEELTRPAFHDFAISLLVLQHLESLQAVADAVGLIAASLADGGLAVIELPARAKLLRARLQPRLRLYRALRRCGLPAELLQRGGLSGISMLTVPDSIARSMFARSGLEVVAREARVDPDYAYARWALRKGPR